MIVTARALYRQCHSTSSHHVDAVIDNLMRDPGEAAATGEEPHRSEIWRAAWDELVCRDLQQKEAVIGQILIQRADHPIAVSRSVHKETLFPPVDIAFGVRVAGYIQPVAAPPFAVAWRSQ